MRRKNDFVVKNQIKKKLAINKQEKKSVIVVIKTRMTISISSEAFEKKGKPKNKR